MSAFFFAINRDGSAFDPRIAQAMMKQLDGFGDDHHQLHIKKNFAIGYQARWTVPEEQLERQPLLLDDHLWFAFLGRVDNRKSLLDSLGISAQAVISDAELVARFLREFGVASLSSIIGPYVFVAFDERNNDIILARDPMGGRYIVTSITKQSVLIATFEMALVAHPSVAYEINQEKMACALLMQQETQSLETIKGLTPLEPGYAIQISDAGTKEFRFYQPPQRNHRVWLSDKEYATEFKRLLTQAVQRRLRGVGDFATSLSGGLDSVPIAIIASQLTASQSANKNQIHQAISWVFERFPEADERTFSQPVCEQFNIKQHLLNCDSVWPAFDADTHMNPIYPFSTPYSEFQQQTFKVANQNKVQHILTGIHGDMLFGHGENVIYEQFRQGKWRQAVKDFALYWRATSHKPTLIKNTLIKPLPGMTRLLAHRQARQPHVPKYLQESVLAQLKHRPHPLFEESLGARRPRQWQNLFGGFAGNDAALGRIMEAKYKVDRRYPMRDRDLCEFMANVPSKQLINGLVHRPIVLNAFDAELPAHLKARNNKTSFNTAINAGMANDKAAKMWFQHSESKWQDFVKEEYFSQSFSPAKESEQSVAMLAWRCAYYNFWYSMCYDESRSVVNESA